MGVCKGNVGNLMQHWTLCEVVQAAAEQDLPHLHFVSTHGMAPWSVPAEVQNDAQVQARLLFDSARNRPTNARNSFYEQVWHDIALYRGLPYPSSAAFVVQAWGRRLSLSLCEADQFVAAEVAGWLKLSEVAEKLVRKQLHRDDWRTGLAAMLDQGDSGVCTLIEMDPMQFDHHQGMQEPGSPMLFPEDLETIIEATEGLTGPIILQMSSYIAQNGNPHPVVEQCIAGPLHEAGFRLQGKAVANGNMISLVYARMIELWNDTGTLGQRFDCWKEGLIQ